MRKEVISLDSAVNNEKYFPLQLYNSLFKDFAEGIETNDYELLSNIVEPYFMKRKLAPNLDRVHEALQEDNLEFKLEYNRKNADETTMFLYNIENFFVAGGPTEYIRRLDRTYFQANRSKYTVQPGESYSFSHPTLNKKNEIEYIDREIQCT